MVSVRSAFAETAMARGRANPERARVERVRIGETRLLMDSQSA
jgi:hypothetical protein